MREIFYQSMGTIITLLLSGSSKNIWPTFPIVIGYYSLLMVLMLGKKHRK
jgi:hypothetical protein